MSVGGISTFQQNGNISISSKTATGMVPCGVWFVRALRLRKVLVTVKLVNEPPAKMDDGNTHASGVSISSATWIQKGTLSVQLQAGASGSGTTYHAR